MTLQIHSTADWNKNHLLTVILCSHLRLNEVDVTGLVTLTFAHTSVVS